MKKNIYIYLLAAFALAGCQKEDTPAPSLADNNWADNLNMNNPRVRECYEKYGFGLLTEFDEKTDMLSNLDSYWDEVRLTKLGEDEVAGAIAFFDETLLKYFTNAAFIKECFPRRILLTREVFFASSETNYLCPATTESDLRASALGNNVLHSMYSNIAFAFSIDMEKINTGDNRRGYELDNLYIFIAQLFERNDLYGTLGADFYLSEMAPYYSRDFMGVGDPDRGIPPGVWVEEGGSPTTRYASQYWYWNKGFVSTENLNWADPRYLEIDLQTYSGVTYSFPSRIREVRTVINQMIYVTEEVYNSYPDIVKGRFAAMMEKFDAWGIDIRSVNPAMEAAFPRN
ncbi:hypothetical protein LJC45_05200 [Alistipes sp. OttesenSCG-928-B03]|nr:hypothetical protein [Alistipes sp. OttesenSCG-928-B03]